MPFSYRARVTRALTGFARIVCAAGIILMELATGKFPYNQPESYFQLFGDIMDKPAPTLPEDGGFTPGFGEFLSLCLDKEPSMRMSAKDLLKHPWLRTPPTGQPAVERESSASSNSSRHDRTRGRGEGLERSRSNLKDSMRDLDLTSADFGKLDLSAGD